MPSHPNRNWRRRWVFNVNTLTASHDNGLTIQFHDAGQSDGSLDGRVIGDVPQGIGHENMARLFREAGDGMAEALKRQVKH